MHIIQLQLIKWAHVGFAKSISLFTHGLYRLTRIIYTIWARVSILMVPEWAFRWEEAKRGCFSNISISLVKERSVRVALTEALGRLTGAFLDFPVALGMGVLVPV